MASHRPPAVAGFGVIHHGPEVRQVRVPGPAAGRGGLARAARGEVVALERLLRLLGADPREADREDVIRRPGEVGLVDRRRVLVQGEHARPAVQDRGVILGSAERADAPAAGEPAERLPVLAAGEVHREVHPVADVGPEPARGGEAVRLGDGEEGHHHQRRRPAHAAADGQRARERDVHAAEPAAGRPGWRRGAGSWSSGSWPTCRRVGAMDAERGELDRLELGTVAGHPDGAPVVRARPRTGIPGRWRTRGCGRPRSRCAGPAPRCARGRNRGATGCRPGVPNRSANRAEQLAGCLPVGHPGRGVVDSRSSARTKPARVMNGRIPAIGPGVARPQHAGYFLALS